MLGDLLGENTSANTAPTKSAPPAVNAIEIVNDNFLNKESAAASPDDLDSFLNDVVNSPVKDKKGEDKKDDKEDDLDDFLAELDKM